MVGGGVGGGVCRGGGGGGGEEVQRGRGTSIKYLHSNIKETLKAASERSRSAESIV